MIAARQASGLAPKVVPWAPLGSADDMALVHMVRPIGNPLARAFAVTRMSGIAPDAPIAQGAPVRNPVWISSAMSRAPLLDAISRAACRYSGEAGQMPPSPWIGSSRMDAVWASTADSSAAMSLKETWVVAGARGSNGARYFWSAVAA